MSQIVRLPILGDSSADCVENWYVISYQIVTGYPVVTSMLHPDVRTCTPPFCISGKSWPIVFKFDLSLGIH